ncbi:MAG: alkaline phosphatase [Deltaproteobacteria bacterium]|jgi:predicted AlkP superfamily pyrophosphatase or phosphodiesterase|nr:alkaline phosphatase [Deltaproteobacteria bacterium]
MHKQICFQIIILIVWAAASGATALKTIVIISIDALHPAALGAGTTPTIFKEMTAGTYTLDGHSTNPPKTLIAHTAMFTGLEPGKNGKSDNKWQPGKQRIDRQTIFDIAKHHGFQTGFFYSKEKLGFLVNSAVDVHRWSREDAIDLAEAFIRKPGRHFVFLHVSGLDFVGPEYGWLSPEYMEELSYIDEYLTPLIRLVKAQKNYVIIITGDHGGHDKIHGSQHPDDYKLAFIARSDVMELKNIQNTRYSVADLKGIMDRVLK